MPHEVSPDAPRRHAAAPTPIQPTIAGRIAIGVVLALGFYLGLRKVLMGTVALLSADPATWWLSFNGLAVVYAAQSVAVVFGALIASAGRFRGYGHGFAVGVVCGGLFLAYELLAGAPVHDLVIYLQPPVLALLGLVAGVVGSRIWMVAPSVDIPLTNQSKISSIQLATEAVTNPGRPTVWVRVMLGAMVMVCGMAMADQTRHFVQKNSAGLLRVQNLGQGEFITWQLGTFLVLMGGIIAGSGTGAGLRHGLIAGLLGSVGVFAFCLKQGSAIPPVAYWLERFALEDLPLTAPAVFFTVTLGVLVVGLVGGWLGGALFLPLAPENMRRRVRSGY